MIDGPSLLFVIGRSLSYGRRGGLTSVLGNGLGALPLVAALAFGAGAIPLQMMVLGLGLVTIGFICDAVWAILGRGHRRRTNTARLSAGILRLHHHGFFEVCIL